MAKNSNAINPLELYSKNQLCSISSNMWSRPATALLIEMYRKLECLWKTNSIYYRNKKKRHDALQEIATAITPFRPDTTVEDVKNKINGIRTQYVAEKNKVAFYAKRNPHMEYEPSLWCYDRLSFLAPYTSLKTKHNNNNEGNSIMVCNEEADRRISIKTEELDDAEVIECADFPQEEPEACDSTQFSTEIGKKRSREEYPEDFRSIEKIFINSKRPEVTIIRAPKKISFDGSITDDSGSISQKHEDTGDGEDWIDVFGKFVASQMRLVTNKTLLMQLQHTIQSAIMNTQLKQIELDGQ